MPELVMLSEADPIHETTWLIEPILPTRDVILLDGAAGCGKTMTLATFASCLSHKPDQKIIFISSPEQKLARATFLKSQARDYTRLGSVEFSPSLPSLDGKRPLHLTFLNFVTDTIVEHSPTCLMIDGLDEMLSPGDEADAKLSREFWTSLRELAAQSNCSIIVSRSSGMHESRNYGAFTKAGTDLARFILTLHWHPEAMDKRLVCVAKHQFGPIGRQTIIQFDGKRALLCCMPDMEDYVKPAKSPQCKTLAQTLGKDTPLSKEEAHLIGKMEEMKSKGASDIQIYQILDADGYARTRVQRLMNHRTHMTMKENKEVMQMYKHMKATEKLENVG